MFLRSRTSVLILSLGFFISFRISVLSFRTIFLSCRISDLKF